MFLTFLLQVCNHPELFERADVVAPYSFADFGRSGPVNREGDFVQLPYSTRNPIEVVIPKLLYYGGGLLDVPQEDSLTRADEDRVAKLMNIWSPEKIYRSLYGDGMFVLLANVIRSLTWAVHRIVCILLFEVYEYVTWRSTCPSCIPSLIQETSGVGSRRASQ